MSKEIMVCRDFVTSIDQGWNGPRLCLKCGRSEVAHRIRLFADLQKAGLVSNPQSASDSVGSVESGRRVKWGSVS